MLSRPEIITENYVEEYGMSNVVDGYYLSTNPDELQGVVLDENYVDWSKGTWYVAPTDS